MLVVDGVDGTAGAAGQVGVGTGTVGAVGDAECTAVGQVGGAGVAVDAVGGADEGRLVGAVESGGCCSASDQCACPASLQGHPLDPGCHQGCMVALQTGSCRRRIHRHHLRHLVGFRAGTVHPSCPSRVDHQQEPPS